MTDRERLRKALREIEELKVAANTAADLYESEITRLLTALGRICSVQLEEPKQTDPDWKAHLMQKIALEAVHSRGNR